MGGEYFSQLHVAEDRSLGEARIGQELVDEQGNAQILERNGAPGRTRTCDPLLRRQVTSFFQLHCFHPFPPIINNLGYLLSLSQQPHSLPNIGF